MIVIKIGNSFIYCNWVQRKVLLFIFCSLLLLSVDSFLSVKWPMKYRVGDLMTARKALILIAIVWIFSILLGFLPLLAKDIVTYRLSFFTFQYLPVIGRLPVSTPKVKLLCECIIMYND